MGVMEPRSKIRVLLALAMLVSASQTMLFLVPPSPHLDDVQSSNSKVSWNFNSGSNSSVLLPVGGDFDCPAGPFLGHRATPIPAGL